MFHLINVKNNKIKPEKVNKNTFYNCQKCEKCLYCNNLKSQKQYIKQNYNDFINKDITTSFI